MSIDQISIRGGAKIGWVSASWPFARLTVDGDTLEIDSMGHYRFARDQVVSIEKKHGLPIIGGSIRIVHTVAEYPANIIFYAFGNLDTLLWNIQETGFIPGAVRETSELEQPKRGVPFKWAPIILVAVLWNALVGVDVLSSQREGKPGPFSILALAIIFLSALGVLKSRRIEHVFLKPGRSVSEIKNALYLLMLVTGIMAVMFGALMLLANES